MTAVVGIAQGPSAADASELLPLLAGYDATAISVDPVSLGAVVLGQASPTLSALGATFALSALVAPAELETLTAAVRAARPGDAPVVLELEGSAAGGAGSQLRISLRSPRPGQVVALVVDVTAVRLGERTWHEVEAWLAALGEALPFDFWVCGHDGRLLLQNPAARRSHGSAVGRTVEEWLEPRASAVHWTACFTRALAGELVREELELDGQDGRRVISRVAAPITDEGEIRGVLGLDMDVTELKRTEQQLREANQGLVQAQLALVRREQLAALGEMSAVVAHEVRNPLGAIFNALTLLGRTQQPDPHAAELLGIVAEEAQRIERLVAGMLDLVRPLSLQRSPVSLPRLLDDAVERTLEPGGGEVRVVRQFEADLPPVHADQHFLLMALTNLVRNALQAMQQGGELTLEARRDGASARLWIRDTGAGIPPHVAARVFEPFVTTRPSGSGLGLAIVRRIVLEHGGEVALESQPGQGTQVALALPLAGEG